MAEVTEGFPQPEYPNSPLQAVIFEIRFPVSRQSSVIATSFLLMFAMSSRMCLFRPSKQAAPSRFHPTDSSETTRQLRF
jgi:hypothetical protein